MIVVGFTGFAQSGKTTCAKYLSKRMSGLRHSFATPLKTCIADLFDFNYEQLYGKTKEVVDKRYGVTPRLIMQRFGTEFVRTTVPNLWCILMEKEIKNSMSKCFIVDDIRFNDEYNLIAKYGTVFEVRRPGITGSDHESERGVKHNGYVIHNDGSLDDLEDQIVTICNLL